MGVFLFAAVALIGFRLWMRLAETERALEELTERVSTLEFARGAAAPIADAREHLKADETPAAPVTPSQPPAPVLQPAAPRPAVDAAPSHDREALESRIGSRWLLYIGVVAIVVGVSYFEKLAIDNHWVNETWRVIQGGVAGLALVFGGLHIVKRGFRLYGQILAGTGVAILYVSTYAAFNFYHLVSHPAAFVLMSVITTSAAWLANSQRSQGLALVAISGGFATPFLLPSATDAEVALFGYDCVLIAGTTFLARRRDWPVLNIVSYTFTALTFLSWAAIFYSATTYLTTEIFLTVFCGLFLHALLTSYRSTNTSAKIQRAILWTAPLGYYVLSIANLFDHSAALLIYFVILALTGVITGSRTNSWIRLLFWFAVAAPLLVWSGTHGGRLWLVSGLAAWVGVYVLNLAGLFEATLDKGRTLRDADIALLHLNGLATYLGAYLLIEPVRIAAGAPLAAGLALLNLAFGFLVKARRREQALHFMALASTFITIAIAMQFDGAWVTNGWALEGALVTGLGLRERRPWLRVAGLALFGAALGRLVGTQIAPPSVGETVLLNSRAASGLFAVALTYAVAHLHRRYRPDHKQDVDVSVALVLAQLLTLAVAASEIAAYWQLHVPPPFEPAAQLIVAAILAGTSTVWLGLRRRAEWVRAIGGGVLAIAAFALFSIQLGEAPLEYVAVMNGRAAAGAIIVLILYGIVVLHRRMGNHIRHLSADIAVITTGASLLTLSLLTSEIDAFWAARGAASAWSMAREGLHSVAWASIGGFLIWYGLSSRRLWSRGIGGGLLLVAIYRMVRLHFVSPSPGYAVVLNARAMTSIVVIAVLYGLARLYQRDATEHDPEEGRATPATALRLVANTLTLTLLTSEITAYWQVFDARQVSRSASADMHFAREMMLSLTWAIYATVLIVVGLFKKYAPIRYFAMAVFAITIVKVFAIDLAELDRIYRVLSIIGLGITLLLTSYLYQKLSADPEHS